MHKGRLQLEKQERGKETLQDREKGYLKTGEVLRPSKQLVRHELQLVDRIAEASEQWLKLRGERFVRANADSAILEMFMSDCTPFTTLENIKFAWDEFFVLRRARISKDLRTAAVFVYVGFNVPCSGVDAMSFGQNCLDAFQCNGSNVAWLSSARPQRLCDNFCLLRQGSEESNAQVYIAARESF